MPLKPSPLAISLPPISNPMLEAYARRVLAADALALKPPRDNLLFVEGVTSIVLHREPPYQVELIVVAPNVTIPPHVHDDVDSIEVTVSGTFLVDIAGVACGSERAPRPDGTSRDFLRSLPIRHDAPHGGRALEKGGSFLSIQFWRNGVPPTHVGLNWRGATMGAVHTKAIVAPPLDRVP